MIITAHHVDLRPNEAKAVSYAWGEFDRKPQSIGHWSNGDEVLMELGKEWEISALMPHLHRLCAAPESSESAGPTPLWIDQLCIRQNDAEEVRDTLAKIPDIFRNFETVILFPGSQCECMEKDYSTLAADKTNMATHMRLMRDPCPSLLSIYIWSSRVWTRQELLYAKKFRIIWVGSRRTTKCLKPIWNERQMKSFVTTADRPALYWLLRFSREMESIDVDLPHVLKVKTRHLVHRAWMNLRGTLAEWLVSMDDDPTFLSEVNELSCRAFLSGRQFQAYYDNEEYKRGSNDQSSVNTMLQSLGLQSNPMSSTERKQLLRFCQQLCQLRGMHRKATKGRDYVLSIWVDCPRYEVPHNFSDMSPGELLQDAIVQLEENFGVYPSTTIPSAVLQPSDVIGRSALPYAWRPKSIVDAAEGRHLSDIYGSFPYTRTIPFCDDQYMRTGSQIAAIDVEDQVRGSLTEIIPDKDGQLSFIESVVKAWSYDCHETIGSFSPDNDWGGLFYGDPSDPVFNKNLVMLHIEDILNEGMYEESTISKDKNVAPREEQSFRKRFRHLRKNVVDFDEVAYEATCSALGLRASTAKHLGLKLMVRQDPPMLGLTGLDVNKLPPKRRIVFLHACQARTRSSPEPDPTLAYECYPEPDEDSVGDVDGAKLGKLFPIMGTWVPIRHECQTWPSNLRDEMISGDPNGMMVDDGGIAAYVETGRQKSKAEDISFFGSEPPGNASAADSVEEQSREVLLQADQLETDRLRQQVIDILETKAPTLGGTLLNMLTYPFR